MSEPYPKLTEQQHQTMNLAPAQSDANAIEHATMATPEQPQVPPTETLGTEEFMHERASTLRGTWFNKAKALAARAHAFIESIEYGGYQLPSAETRFNGTASDSEEHRPIVTHDYVADRTTGKTLNHYGGQAEQDSGVSSADITMIAGRRITTLPAIRPSGLMALHGAAASDRMTVKTSPVANMKR